MFIVKSYQGRLTVI